MCVPGCYKNDKDQPVRSLNDTKKAKIRHKESVTTTAEWFAAVLLATALGATLHLLLGDLRGLGTTGRLQRR